MNVLDKVTENGYPEQIKMLCWSLLPEAKQAACDALPTSDKTFSFRLLTSGSWLPSLQLNFRAPKVARPIFSGYFANVGPRVVQEQRAAGRIEP
jgi:hypothetical protein